MSVSGQVVENFFGVYLLYCINPKYKGRTYIGYTVDPNRRIKQHNRGVKAGGAYRTSRKGPWDMVLIVHGFPNDISALRFEWAWQHPDKSRRLRGVVAKKKKGVFDFSLRVLAAMLRTNPWARLPLTVRWLKQEYFRDFPAGLEPPVHMPIAFGPVKAAKITSDSEDFSAKGDLLLCDICACTVASSDCMRCVAPSCTLTVHVRCLADNFLEKDSSRAVLPVEGTCPSCNNTILWGDLVRLKNGCYQQQSADNTEQAHWSEGLSQPHCR